AGLRVERAVRVFGPQFVAFDAERCFARTARFRVRGGGRFDAAAFDVHFVGHRRAGRSRHFHEYFQTDRLSRQDLRFDRAFDRVGFVRAGEDDRRVGGAFSDLLPGFAFDAFFAFDDFDTRGELVGEGDFFGRAVDRAVARVDGVDDDRGFFTLSQVG